MTFELLFCCFYGFMGLGVAAMGIAGVVAAPLLHDVSAAWAAIAALPLLAGVALATFSARRVVTIARSGRGGDDAEAR